jgi:hypothetical protein
MRAGWRAGQTTTEFLMISGLMTAITIVMLKFVFAASCPGIGSGTRDTIQCVLSGMADRIINMPDGESEP